MKMKSTCKCNIQDGKIEVTSVGGGYFGELNPETKKIKLNFKKTIKSHIGYLLIWVALAFAVMASLAIIGLLVSLPLRLFDVDISSLNNWFYNIFRFGKLPNILLPLVLVVFPYVTNAVQTYTMYRQEKRKLEHK